MIDELRDDDVGEQAGPDAASRQRFARQRGFGDLRIVPVRLAMAADIGGPRDLADEQRRGLVIEPLADIGADAVAQEQVLVGLYEDDTAPRVAGRRGLGRSRSARSGRLRVTATAG